MKEKFKCLLGSIGYMGLGVGIYVIFVAIFVGFLTMCITQLHRFSNVYKQIISVVFHVSAGFIIVLLPIIAATAVLGVFLRRGNQIRDKLLPKKLSVEKIVFSIGIGICIGCITKSVFQNIGGVRTHEIWIDKLKSLGWLVSIEFIYFLSIASTITFPIIQEILFRGIIYPNLRKKFPNSVALIIQTLLFSLWCTPSKGFIYYAVLGIILGYIAYQTQSIWLSFIANCISRMVSFILTCFSSGPVGNLQTLVLLGVGIIGMGVLTIFLVRSQRIQEKLYTETNPD